MADLTLHNGLVVTPAGIVRGGLAAAGGRIIAVGADEALPRSPTDIDVGGKLIFPGAIDPHTHLGVGHGQGIKMGFEKFQREFFSESQDAATGGVTTVISTTRFGPGAQTTVVDAMVEAGKGHSYVDYRLSAGISNRDHIREIPDLLARGVRSFKFLLGYHGEQARSLGAPEAGIGWAVFYEACEALGGYPGAFAMIHAEEPAIRDITVPRGRASGRTDFLQAWHEANPDLLEPMQIYPAALIAREKGCPLYVVHASAAESVDLILYLRERGVDITGETLVAYLYYTAEECDRRGLGAYAKVQPPIRSAKDRNRLWRGLNDGGIRCVGTDCLLYSKGFRQGDFWDVAVGLGPGMSCTIPAVYTAGVLGGRITMETMAKVLSENAARRFGIYPQKGVLQPGSDADVVVVDQNRSMTIDAAALKSAAGYSIYDGLTLHGIPALTFVRGQLVAKDYEIVADRPQGCYVG